MATQLGHINQLLVTYSKYIIIHIIYVIVQFTYVVPRYHKYI